MATTSLGAAKRLLRPVVFVAVAGAAAAASTFASFGHHAVSKPKLGFWTMLGGHAGEKNPPANVAQITKRADAVVVAHLVDVVDGRTLTPLSDPTPADPTIPAPRTVFLHLAVDRQIRGSASSGTTITLEMPAPPSPLTASDLRAQMPTGQLLYFLTSNEAEAGRLGYTSASVRQREHGIWGTTSERGILGSNSTGLYEALEPDPSPEEASYLNSFNARTVDEAAQTAAHQT